MQGSSKFGEKARDLYSKAEKTLKGSFFGNLTKGKQDRADDAKDLFLQAANCYKLAQDMENAYNCYQRCIDCEESEQDAAAHYKEAANCIKETDSDKYVIMTKQAIDLYSLSGRSSTAATMARDCAQKLEEEYDFDQASDFFSKAAQLYEMDNQSTNANQ